MNLGQIVQSHALSFFHLSAPRPAARLGQRPGQAQRLRPDRGRTASWPAAASACGSSARRSSRRSAARRSIRPGPCPAASARPLTAERRDDIRGRLPEAQATALGRARAASRSMLDTLPRGGRDLRQLPVAVPGPGRRRTAPGSTTTASSASCDADGHDRRRPARPAALRGVHRRGGRARFVPEIALLQAARLPRRHLPRRPAGPAQRLRAHGHAAGRPRTGRVPPARRPARSTSSFFYHYARLIEILAATRADRAAARRPRPALGPAARRRRRSTGCEGVGVSEAPRGTLFHHYQVDEDGLLTKVNLIIATGQNNLAMNRTVAQIAQHYIRGPEDPRGRAEPPRGRHPRLRPVPELLDARRRPDAADRAADRARRRGPATRCGANDATFLVIGYGNELRGDDGVGPRVARTRRRLGTAGGRWAGRPSADARAGRGAGRRGDGRLRGRLRRRRRSARSACGGWRRARAPALGHTSDPRWLLALTEAAYGRRPEAWLVTVPASDFELGRPAVGRRRRAGMSVALRQINRLVYARNRELAAAASP